MCVWMLALFIGRRPTLYNIAPTGLYTPTIRKLQTTPTGRNHQCLCYKILPLRGYHLQTMHNQHSPKRAKLPSIVRQGYEIWNMKYEIQYENMKNTLKCSPERAELPNIVREGYDTPQLNDHNKIAIQRAQKASLLALCRAIAISEYPPMHTRE